MSKLLPILHVLSKLVLLYSLLFAVPCVVSWLYHDGTARHFAHSALAGGVGGSLLWLLTRRFERELKPRDGFILVVLLWITFALMSAIPMLLYVPGLSFTDGFFEAISGLTTTGSTVLSGLERLPPAINFWRHFINWVGGMGIIVLAVAILPLLGIGGMQLYKAEIPGPMKDSKLAPRIAQTAANLWYVYAALTLLCMLSLWLAGMTPFDALCHALAAMSLSGVSTHDAGIAYFDSPAIELVLSCFMVLGALNFATHFLCWRNRSLKFYLLDVEARHILALLAGSILLLSGWLWWLDIYSFHAALRHVSFNLISIATDAGFASVDYAQWPIVVPLWMLFLSCVTASSGSVGGGIKMIRTLILTRQGYREMNSLLHPRAVLPLMIGTRVIPDSVAFSVLGFIFVYFISVVLLTFTMIASGLDFISSFSVIVSCINNAGPALGQLGPASNYAGLSDFQTWVCSFAMLLGRLEIFTILILFTPTFWRK